MAEFGLTALRVFCAVAERGSFTAAGRDLGYTQSAVSRQVAGLEAAAGRSLVQRGRRGVTLTAEGARLLAHATRALGELDAAHAELAGQGPSAGLVRLGAFPAAIAGLVPRALAALGGDVVVSVREGTTPALVRALRAGALDLALVAQAPPFRPPDAEAPALALTVLGERDLLVAVGPRHPLAGRRAVEVAELEEQVWVTSRSEAGESLLGVWPGLTTRPDVRYVVRDWLAKLRLVAANLAITTVPPVLAAEVPVGVKLLAVRGEPQEARRIVLARLPGREPPGIAVVVDALRAALEA